VTTLPSRCCSKSRSSKEPPAPGSSTATAIPLFLFLSRLLFEYSKPLLSHTVTEPLIEPLKPLPIMDFSDVLSVQRAPRDSRCASGIRPNSIASLTLVSQPHCQPGIWCLHGAWWCCPVLPYLDVRGTGYSCAPEATKAVANGDGTRAANTLLSAFTQSCSVLVRVASICFDRDIR
jgi:hypothetical protein